MKPVAVAAQPVSSVVELLETLLAEARAGKLQSVALAYETEGTRTTSHAWAWQAQSSVTMLVGELERLKYRLVHRLELCD